MTLNHFKDNETAWAGRWNAILNAPGSEVIVSGCTPSKGTNDWDVDVASGTVRIDGSGDVSVSAQTEDLADPTSDMSSGEERVVIVTLNSSGNTNSVEGTAVSSNPVTPDIPSGEVLVALVHVENADATIADSDLFDTRVIVNDGEDSGVNADKIRGMVPIAESGDTLVSRNSTNITNNNNWQTLWDPTDSVDVVAFYAHGGLDSIALRYKFSDGSTQRFDHTDASGQNNSPPFEPVIGPAAPGVDTVEARNNDDTDSTVQFSAHHK